MKCANLKCENIFATKWTYSHLWDPFLDLFNNHWHNITPWQDCIGSVCVCVGGGGGGGGWGGGGGGGGGGDGGGTLW